MSDQIYDVIVVGGGAIGLGATYEVAKSGASVLVLEQNCFYNQAGSSGDLARMYRTMYTEDFMADMAKDSLSMWYDLEKDAGTSLRTMSGLLNFGNPKLGDKSPEGTLLDPIKNLERLKMSYTKLTRDQIEQQYPFKNLPDNYEGVFAPDNGVINVPLMLRTLSRLARDYGAHAQQNVQVKCLVPEKVKNDDIWKVQCTRHGEEPVEFQAKKIIVTAGAYANHITVPSFSLRLKLKIWEMTASYFAVNPGPRGTVFPSMWFQFAEPVGKRSQYMYGFPALEWGPPNVCRIAVDAATNIIDDPDQRSASVVSPEDIADVQDFVKDRVIGVDSTVPASSLVCLMPNVLDNMFVLDYIPEKYLNGGAKNSVVLYTAGWAMKFVPLLGQALKDMALKGGSKYALDEFNIDRKDKDTGAYIVIDENTESPDAGVATAGINSLRMSEEKVQAQGSSYHHVYTVT